MDPTDTTSMGNLVYLYGRAGKISSARQFTVEPVHLDPLTPFNHWLPAWADWMDGRFDIALAVCRKCHELEPDSNSLRWHYVQSLLWNDRIDEADMILQAWLNEMPSHVMPLTNLFLIRARQGRKADALASIADEWKSYAWKDYHLPMVTAEAYSVLDEEDEALTWLEHAVD